MLKDLLECAVCRRRMVPGDTQKQGRQYRYYVCLTAQKRGVPACPGQTVAAHRIEPAVIQRLQDVAVQPGWEGLRAALQVDASGWDGMEREALVERVTFHLDQSDRFAASKRNLIDGRPSCMPGTAYIWASSVWKNSIFRSAIGCIARRVE